VCTLTRTSSKSPGALLGCALLAASALLALPATCRARAPQPIVEAQPLSAHTDLVRLDVSVLDKHGNFAAGLTQNDFRVLDNGVERPIVFFAPVEAPARVLVMIETSPAVYLIHDEHLAAAYALVHGLDPADQVALVTYSDVPRKMLDFTTHKSEFLAALSSLQYMIGMGQLNFYDSLSAVVDSFPPAEGKSAIVLLTTGIDSSPASHWEPLVQKLRGTDVVIFSVALGGVLRGDASKPKRKKHGTQAAPDDAQSADSLGELTGFARADRALKLLAQITGGRAYFPQSDRDFTPIYSEIVAVLRHQYVVGIAPARDGKFHALDVQVVPGGAPEKRPKKPAYRIFARQGYIAPAN
jgi:Ca-activated chloride channel homolog